MRLTLSQLQSVARKTAQQERALRQLRSELKNVFGPTLDVDRPLGRVIREVNDVLSSSKFRESPPAFKVSLALVLAENDNVEVRRLAAHLLPNNLTEKLAFDKDATVRHIVAWRASPRVLDEMFGRWPGDDQLVDVIAQRGLLVEKVETKKYTKRGDSVKQWEGEELSDVWYESRVIDLMNKYMNNLEYCWEEVATRRFASSYRATTGVEIDEKKLYDLLKKKISEREDQRLKALDDDPLREQPLKETLDWLRLGGHSGFQNAFPIVETQDDVVKSLLDENNSAAEYVRKFNSLFAIKESSIPISLKKFRIGEAKGVMKIPSIGCTPSKELRYIDEKALDRYVSCWNVLQERNESADPIRIKWNPSQSSQGSFSFEAILK